MPLSLLLATALLVIGVILRSRVRLLARLYLPSSVVGGLLGFVVLYSAQRNATVGDSIRIARVQMGSWSTLLISIVFAGLLLERPEPRTNETPIDTLRQGMAAWIVILGQLALGLLAVWLMQFVRPVSIHLGQLLEVSWAGGFGSSGGWGDLHERAHLLPGARDLAFFGATSGLLYGVLSGLVLVNLALRRGWTARPAEPTEAVGKIGTEVTNEADAIGFARIRREIVDPLTLQVLLVLSALGVGYAMQWGVQWIGAAAGEHAANSTSARLLSHVEDLPLFLFALLGGWIVRRCLQLAGHVQLIDTRSLHRIGGLAMDFLIVSALAALRVEKVSSLLVPVLVLCAIGAVWCAFNLIWISPRVLPRECWFELGLLNYGFATATTAQGMMLLRIVDRDLKTDAARIYALAAPLTAPFIGGGIITFALPALLQEVHAIWIILAAATGAIALYFAGRKLTLDIERQGSRSRSIASRTS